ncbi:hypothetical protein LFE01_10320 [Limosilactobacillus fermentum]|nr:hypothetical protein LFE01_10320 [Limosilactobacillus fermentum]
MLKILFHDTYSSLSEIKESFANKFNTIRHIFLTSKPREKMQIIVATLLDFSRVRLPYKLKLILKKSTTDMIKLTEYTNQFGNKDNLFEYLYV